MGTSFKFFIFFSAVVFLGTGKGIIIDEKFKDGNDENDNNKDNSNQNNSNKRYLSYIIGMESMYEERAANVYSNFNKILNLWKKAYIELPISASILQPVFWNATTINDLPEKGNDDFNTRQMACLYSHMQLFRYLIKSYLDEPNITQAAMPVMVWEDDVHCVPAIMEELDPYLNSLPDDWDMAYLGGKPMSRPVGPDGTENIVYDQPWWKVFFMSNTHAYMVHPRAWRKLVKHWDIAAQRKQNEFVDAVLSRLQTLKLIHAYMPTRPICQQVQGYSLIEKRFIAHADIAHADRKWLMGLYGEGVNPYGWDFHQIPPNPPRPRKKRSKMGAYTFVILNMITMVWVTLF